MRRPVQMRAKRHALFGYLPQITKTENLESARIGQNRARPRHEPVQAAHPSHLLDSRPQIKMIGIAKKNLYVKVFENVLRNAFYRAAVPTGMKTGVCTSP